jgi:hypothetical protein
VVVGRLIAELGKAARRGCGRPVFSGAGAARRGAEDGPLAARPQAPAAKPPLILMVKKVVTSGHCPAGCRMRGVQWWVRAAGKERQGGRRRGIVGATYHPAIAPG